MREFLTGLFSAGDGFNKIDPIPRVRFRLIPSLSVYQTLIIRYLCAGFLFAGISLPVCASESLSPDNEYAIQAKLAVRSLLLDAAISGQRIIAVGEQGHILLSEDDGRNWRQSQVPTRATLTAVYFSADKLGWAVGHDAIILHSSDGGENWIPQHYDREFEFPLLDVWFKDSRKGYAIGAYGLFLATTDGGKTWTRKTVSQDDFHLNSLAVIPDGRLFIAGEAGHLYRSDDGGSTWLALDSPYVGSYFGILALENGGLLIYGLRGKIFRSEDGGTTWQRIASKTNASLMGGTVLVDGRVVLVGLGGTVLVSRNNGRSFSKQPQTDRSGLVSVIQAVADKLILFGEAGVSSHTLQRHDESRAAEPGQVR